MKGIGTKHSVKKKKTNTGIKCSQANQAQHARVDNNKITGSQGKTLYMQTGKAQEQNTLFKRAVGTMDNLKTRKKKKFPLNERKADMSPKNIFNPPF